MVDRVKDGEAEEVGGSDQEGLSWLSKGTLMSSRKLGKDHQLQTPWEAGVGIRPVQGRPGMSSVSLGTAI